MKKSLIFIQSILCLFIYAGVSAQTYPVLPAPNYETDHDATISGAITVSGSTQKLAGVVVILSRVLTSPTSYVPVSYALSETDGTYSLTGQSGVTYRVTYQYPTAGFTVQSGGISANFAAVAGANTVPGGGLVLARNLNTVTSCNVSASNPTNWNGTLAVAKPVIANDAVLSEVTVYNSAKVINPLIEITAGASSGIYAKLDIGARVVIRGPENTPINSVESTKKFAGTLTEDPDQRIHLAAGTKLTYYDISSAASVSGVLESIPEAYTSTSPVNVDFRIQADALTATENQGGNATFALSTFASAGACITYTYTTNPLPVALSSFSAKAKVAENTKVTALNWATTSETNSDKFDVERSLNAKEWNSIGSVAASFTSGTEKKYTFDDVQPLGGVSYYRLKMIDKDATFSYSRIVKVQYEGDSEVVSLFPNPVSDELFVKDADSKTVKLLTIFNTAGKSVYQTASVSSDKGINVKNLSAGMYIVKISRTDGTYKTQKVLISR